MELFKPVNQSNPSVAAAAYQYRALIRATDPARHAEARADLEESKKLLEQRVQESPKVPEPLGHLGRTYLALGRLAKQTNDPAAVDWFRKAAKSLEKALTQSLDNAQDKQLLTEIQAELHK